MPRPTERRPSYVAAIERIAAEGLDANVSIKLSQMGLDLGVDECLAVMAPVAAAGDAHRIFIRIDMESSAYTGRTLEVVDRLRAAGHDVGPVIQSYLLRSVDDVERLASARVRTRICKGAYAEPPEVAHQDRVAVGDAFVNLCEDLLRADAYPGVATHDPEMLDRVATFARERGIGPDRFEFQMLFGVRRDLQRQLIEKGYRLRIYVPYGTEWYPYFMRRLAERPANVAVRPAQHLRGAFLKGGRAGGRLDRHSPCPHPNGRARRVSAAISHPGPTSPSPTFGADSDSSPMR